VSQDPTYLLRWKGQQVGPFTKEIIEQKVRDRELSLAHEVSVDGKWRSLRGFLKLQAQTQEQDRQKNRLKRMQDELDQKEVSLQDAQSELDKTRDELEEAKQQPSRLQAPQFSAPVANAIPGVAVPSAYSCPRCGSPFPPQIVKKLSTLGWIVFVIGLFFCLVGCLFAFFCFEEKKVCPSCGYCR
jgi:hypothetical protein